MDLLRPARILYRVCVLGACALGLLGQSTRAQVVPAAYGSADTLWVGAEYSNMDASFPYQSGDRLAGVGVFADFNLRAHLGLEGDARFMQFGGYQAETERTLLGGPRFRFNRLGKFQPYAQGLIGAATVQYPFKIGQASYLAVAPAGGVSYRVSGRWLVRAQYEYQFWLNSPGYVNEPAHQLKPNGLQVGVAFRLLR